MEDPIVVQSAVRLPTPPPASALPSISSSKRKRSPSSHPPSPRRKKASVHDKVPVDDDAFVYAKGRGFGARRLDGDLLAAIEPTADEKQAAAKAEYEKLLSMRSGGTYIPPARLRALQAQITDRTSKEYQRMAWEALKKSINGLINKVNVSNIKHIVPELFGENLIRGRGLFCRSIMKAQAASLPFTPIYAAMAAIVNTKLPQVGELLLSRLVVQFKKAFKRNDKAVCLSSTTFIAHLANQQVVHETLAAQILLLLLHKPTDDSVEIAVGLTREVGQHMEDMSSAIALAVFDQFRNILHEHDLDKRVQYMIEVLFQIRKDKYKDNPAIKEELDLVEEEDQITHQLQLDESGDVQEGLNIFRFDPDWEEHENAYRKLKTEILGEDSGSDGEYETDDSSEDEETKEEKAVEIKDQSNTDLVNLRRTIYLTIMSSIDFEECCHKLMKVTLPAGKESELPSMIIECCSQEKTYSKFYGLIGERFAKLNRLWTEHFENSFTEKYETIHRYETNRLRNVARFFGHMLGTEAIGWHVLSVVHLNEEETTSSSRIFIKILFQDLVEALGMPCLKAKLESETIQPSLDGIFPADSARKIRFSINYFTSIGMGAITEGMREKLKNMPKPVQPSLPAPPSSDSEHRSYSSYSSYTGSSRSYSRSRSRSRSRSHSRARSELRERGPTRSPARSASRLQTPPRGRGRERSRSYTSSVSRSRSLSRRKRHPSYSRSRSRSRSYTPLTRNGRKAQFRGYSRSVTPLPQRSNARHRESRSSSRSPDIRANPREGSKYQRSHSPLPYRVSKNSSSSKPWREYYPHGRSPRSRSREGHSSPSSPPLRERRSSHSRGSRASSKKRNTSSLELAGDRKNAARDSRARAADYL